MIPYQSQIVEIGAVDGGIDFFPGDLIKMNGLTAGNDPGSIRDKTAHIILLVSAVT